MTFESDTVNKGVIEKERRSECTELTSKEYYLLNFGSMFDDTEGSFLLD